MTGQSLVKLKKFSKWINLHKTSTLCISPTKHDQNIDVDPASGKVIDKKDQHEKSPKETKFIHNSVREGNSAVSTKCKNFKTFSKWIRLDRNIGNSCASGDNYKNIAFKCENIKKKEQNEGADNGGKEKATNLLSSPNRKKFKTFSRWIQISPEYDQCRKQNKMSIRSINKVNVENDSMVRATVISTNDEKMASSCFKEFEKLKTFFTPRCSDSVTEKCCDQNNAWTKEETNITNSKSASLFGNSVENPSLANYCEKLKRFSRRISLQKPNASLSYEKSRKENISNGLQVFYGKRYLENCNKVFLSGELNLFDETEPFLSIDLDSSFDETIFEKPRGSSTPKKKYQSKTFAMESNEEKPLFHHKGEIENRLNRNLFPTLNDTTETLGLNYKITKKTSVGLLDKKNFEESPQTLLDEETGELFYLRDYFLLSSSPPTIFGKNAMKPDWLIKCEQKLKNS